MKICYSVLFALLMAGCGESEHISKQQTQPIPPPQTSPKATQIKTTYEIVNEGGTPVMFTNDSNIYNPLLAKILVKKAIGEPDNVYRGIDRAIKNYGMSIVHVTVINKKNIHDIEDNTLEKIGDIEYQISTDLINTEACKNLSSPSFLYRNGKYYALDKTANWLLNNKCTAP